MLRLFYHSMLLISPSFGASRKLHFVCVALPGYLQICFTDIKDINKTKYVFRRKRLSTGANFVHVT